MRKIFCGAAVVGFVLAGALSPSTAESVRGFGRDVPLSFAVRQVVPDGWSVTFGVGVDTNQHVNWKSASDWRAVIEEMAGRKGLVVSYDVDHRTLRLTRPDDPRPIASDPMRSSRGGFVMVPYHGAQPVEGVAYTSAEGGTAIGNGMWRADKDQPLRSVLQEWAARSGWSLVWNAGFEYRLQAGAVFTGDFVQAAGDLVKSLQNARPAVTATFYKGNRVLVVANDDAGAN
jgi:hypothetical protein